MTGLDMTDHIHQSNLIEGFDSELADAQSLAAWDWLLKVELTELDHQHIMSLQSRITSHQDDLRPEWRGKYRTIPVYIGGHEAMDALRIPAAMFNWISKVHLPETRAHAHHVEFEHIHPFVDGNGRTGRMLMWWLQVKRGIKPTFITYEGRQAYYGWFK